MGEAAEMMLDGTCCVHCGELLIHGPEDVPNGFPSSCGCDRDDDLIDLGADSLAGRTCHICKKVLKTEDGCLEHMHAKHPGWDTDDDIVALVEVIQELYPLAEERANQKGYCGPAPDFMKIQAKVGLVMSMNAGLFT